MQHQDVSIFLAESVSIAELDHWIIAYQKDQRRFTFTETEVLQAYWQQGEDILLREDSRFKAVVLPDQQPSGQWQLSNHLLANQQIYDELFYNEWDGEDLDHFLQQLDQQRAENTFHIVCTVDKRFSFSQNETGSYRVTLNQNIARMSLSHEHKKALDAIASQLLAAFSGERRAPWATFDILEQVQQTASTLLLSKPLLPAELAQWLRQRDEWASVGRDLWFPKQYLPLATQERRYAVRAVNPGQRESLLSFLEPVEISMQKVDEPHEQEKSLERHVQAASQGISQGHWQVTLRTLHLNEGYIPIPPQVRTLYPHSQKSSNISALPGIWFTDGSAMTVWLDLTRHRLYGPDIADQLAFLEAGTMLKIVWNSAGFTFDLAGQNAEILAEEARLIDLTELADVRSVLLESYRASLRALLASEQQGKTFAELYLALCQRQQHKPNTSTIRTILSASPEFTFDQVEKTWRLLTNLSEEAGAGALRKAVVAAEHVKEPGNVQVLKTLPLATLIARNRQQLIALRNLFKQKVHK